MPRALLLAALAALAMPALADAADAKSSARQRAENARFYEKARADEADPTGKYKGFPDWARFALSDRKR